MSFATRLHSSWTLPLQSVLSAALFLASARPALAASTGENPAETAAAAVQCDSKSDLTAQLSLTGTRGTFTNLSPTCSYEIGIAAYRMFDLRQRNQAIFDWVTATIAPGTTLALNVGCGVPVPCLGADQSTVSDFNGIISSQAARYQAARRRAGPRPSRPACWPGCGRLPARSSSG